MPPCKFVTADEDPSGRGNRISSTSSASNLEAIETASNGTDSSATSSTGFSKPHQLIYGNESFKRYSVKRLDKSYNQNSASVKSMTQVDHIYEEVSAIKESHLLDYDIMDYYEKYSPTTAKTLINTLYLPRHKICKQCAGLQDSPVFSDCMIYAKKPLHAREVYLQQQNDVIFFKYCPDDGKSSKQFSLQYDDNTQPCMLVYNYLKPNASGVLYFYVPSREIFDLKMSLKPHVLLTSSKYTGPVNTQLYHRCVSNFSKRISNSGTAPMNFCFNHDNILSTIKHIGYNTDIKNWMNYRSDIFRTRSLKQDDNVDHRANRSSLLLLEPLLLMPELTNSRYRHGKNRISHSEHMKIIKIVIAYTLSFFILAIITFYIVYFT